MASDEDMSGWLDLLHSSSKLLDQAGHSAQFPPLLRNLDQLEALSKKLKAKTLRSEVPSRSIAATRLLAREGINAEKLARDLKSFELKTTYEEGFPAEASIVEEYLQQVHKMAMLSANQQAQKNNLRSFNDHMLEESEASVAEEQGDEGESSGRQGMVRSQPSAVPASHIAGESWVTLMQQACYNLLYGPTTEEEINFQRQCATAWENDVVRIFENAAVMSLARRDLEIARKRLEAEERKKQLQVLEGQEWAHLIQQRHYLERQVIQATAANRVAAAEMAVEKTMWAKNVMKDEITKLRMERDAAVDAEAATKQELETAKAGSAAAQEMAKVESSKLKQERDVAVAEAVWVKQKLEQLTVGIFIKQQAHETEDVLKEMAASLLEQATRAEQRVSELELQVIKLQAETAETRAERDALLTEIDAAKQVFALAGEDAKTVTHEVVDAVSVDQGNFANDVAATNAVMRESRQVMAALREMALDLKTTMTATPPAEDFGAMRRLEIQVRLLMEKKTAAEREVSHLRETIAGLSSSLETMVPKVSVDAAMARHESEVLRVGALRCLEQLKKHLACFDVVLDTYNFDFDLLDACDIPMPEVTFSEAGTSSQFKG